MLMPSFEHATTAHVSKLAVEGVAHVVALGRAVDPGAVDEAAGAECDAAPADVAKDAPLKEAV
jgi:hypothetical protein